MAVIFGGPVNAAVLYVKVGGAGVQDGSSWSNAFAYLQDALSVAQPADEIWVAEGVYYPDEGAGQVNNDAASTFSLPDQVQVYGGFRGTEALRHLRKPWSRLTVLSGDIAQDDSGLLPPGILPDALSIVGINATHVVSVLGNGTEAHLDGFVITGGQAPVSGVGLPDTAIGGGLFQAPATSLELRNCMVRGNRAQRGGGMVLQSSADVRDSIFRNNLATEQGGGIYVAGGFHHFQNVLIFSNQGTQHGGGVANRGIVDFLHCTLSLNVAGVSGANLYDEGSVPRVEFSRVINSIVWQGAALPAEQNFSNPGGPSVLFQHSAISGLDLSGSDGNFDGTDPGNEPLFVDSSGADYRLRFVSPMINRGMVTLDAQGTDLAGMPRFSGLLPDLGAYEYAARRLHVWPDAGGDETGETWSDAFVHLPDAVSAALEGDEIWITEGVYRPGLPGNPAASFVVNKHLSLYGGFAGTETSLDQRNLATTQTVLSGDLAGDDVVNARGVTQEIDGLVGTNAAQILRFTFTLSGGTPPPPLVLDGLTISGADGFATGAGLSVSVPDSVDLYLLNMRFRGNRGQQGGGMWMSRTAGAVAVISNTVFRANHAYSDGGGLYLNLGGVGGSLDTDIRFMDCTWLDNRSDQDGAGAALLGTATVTIEDSSWSENLAQRDGGALWLRDGTHASIFMNSFSTNSVASGEGGAVAIADLVSRGTSLHVWDSAFTANFAKETGGAVASRFGALRFVDCAFLGNIHKANGAVLSGGGGALYAANSPSPVLLLGCQFDNNATDLNGGAAHFFFSGSRIMLTSFTGNRADVDGGGIYRNASALLDGINVVFAGNRAMGSGGGASLLGSGAARFRSSSFQGNRADAVLGGALGLPGAAPVDFINSVIWNNQAGGATNTLASSVNTTLGLAMQHSLVQGHNPGGTNLDGTKLPAVRFIAMPNPSLAPTSTADLRLLPGSALTNLGDNNQIASTLDMAGNHRIHGGVIDIGAYEFGAAMVSGDTFSQLFPELEMLDDANANGINNYLEYAMGYDPAGTNPPQQVLSDALQITFSSRIGAGDVFPVREYSTDLLAGSWFPLIPGTHVQLFSNVIDGVQQRITVNLLPAITDLSTAYFRQSFRLQAPP